MLGFPLFFLQGSVLVAAVEIGKAHHSQIIILALGNTYCSGSHSEDLFGVEGETGSLFCGLPRRRGTRL